MKPTATLEAPVMLDVLRECELFEGVPATIVADLAACSRIVEFSAGEDIFREFDLAQNVYLIASGRVALAICRPKVGCRQLMELGAGDLLGWSPLVQRPRFSATAHVREATRAIEIDGTYVARICQAHPEFFGKFMFKIAQIVAQRLSATRLQLLETSGVHLPDVPIESD